MQTVDRLIHYFTPESYNLSLDIDRVGRTFRGTVTIKGSSPDGIIKLHAKDLAIDSMTIDGTSAKWSLGDNDELITKTKQTASTNHIVVVGFHGTITDQMHGLYPCYFTHDGVAKELLMTQFESHHAREVFPCVDEPEAKATFDVTVTTETDVTVLGNMPVATQDAANDRLVTRFQTTPRMSTYLLALVVGELQSVSTKTNSGVDVSVWATPAQSSASLEFALKHARETIEFFDEYFGIPYPLPKSDHVAVPDFSSGAMENWGLITYREVALLYDPATSGISSKQYIATVISHELSHQWFGNLVTMQWWDDLWLNESFATIMEYIAVDALYPEWNMWLEFNINEGGYALQRDCLAGVQAVHVDVNHPDEISTLFDPAIVYAKGGRLLRMLQVYLGAEAFRAGLKSYFETYQYKNTVGDNLWDEFERASGKKIREFMTAWVSRSGYPVVSVSRRDDTVSLSQKQFVIGSHKASERLWPIPLGSSDPAAPQTLETEASSYTSSDPRPYLNTIDSAHFITQYDHQLFDRLCQDIADGQLSVIQRAQLIQAQTLLVRSDESTSDTLIDLLSVYTNETEEHVWGMMAAAFGDLKKFVDTDSPAEKALKQLASRLATPLYTKLGWTALPDESEDDTKLRSTVIGMMLYAENADAIREATSRYREQPLDAMDPELRDLILTAEIRHGNTEAAITELLDIYRTTPSVDLQQDISSAVTATRDPAQIKRLIALLTDKNTIRTQDTMRWFVRLLANRDARTEAWDWIRNNWSHIETVFGGDKSYDGFPRYTAQILATRKQLQQYHDFFDPLRSNPSLTRAIVIGEGDLTSRVELIERDKPLVEKRLLQL